MALSRGAGRLFDLLRWYASRYRRIHPPQSKLAELLNVTMRQVRRYLAELREASLVTVQKCGRNSAEYFLSDAGENVRSKSGRSPVEVRSVPYCVSSSKSVSSEQPRKPPQSEGIPDPEYTRRFVEAARRTLVNMDTPEGRPLIATAFQERSGPEEGWSILRGLITQPRFAGRSAGYLAAAYRGELTARRKQA